MAWSERVQSDVDEKIGEEVRKKEKRENEEKRDGEKEENDMVNVRRRCVSLISTAAFDMYDQGEDLETCGVTRGDVLENPNDFSDCEHGTLMDVPAVLVVTDVPVSPSSVVTEFCDGASLGSDWQFC